MIRVVNSAAPVVSRRSLSSGNSGVRSSNRGRFRASSGASPRHRVDADERRELLVRRRGSTGALDEVAPAHGEPAGLADRDVDVLRAREVPVGSEEPVPLVAQVEQTTHRDQLAGVLGLLPTSLELALAATAATSAATRRALTTPAAPAPAIARLVGVPACPPCGMCWRFWFCPGRLGRRRTVVEGARSAEGPAPSPSADAWSPEAWSGATRQTPSESDVASTWDSVETVRTTPRRPRRTSVELPLALWRPAPVPLAASPSTSMSSESPLDAALPCAAGPRGRVGATVGTSGGRLRPPRHAGSGR